MKTITMEYIEYKKDLLDSKQTGFRHGVDAVKSILKDINKGHSKERLLSDYGDDPLLVDLIQNYINVENQDCPF